MPVTSDDAPTPFPKLSDTIYRCDYVARQIAVKRNTNYGVTGAEKTTMTRVSSR